MIHLFIFTVRDWIVLAVQATALLAATIVFVTELPMTEEAVVLVLSGLCITLF